MKTFFKFLFLVTLIGFAGCDEDPVVPSDSEPESEVASFMSNDFGQLSTESGVAIEIIPGTVPPDGNGNTGNVSFSIETKVESPGPLNSGASFIGDMVKFGPENFSFRWPLQLSLPYEEGENPNDLSVMYYDYTIENWKILPKTGIDGEKKLILFNSTQLGVFSLARITSEYRSEDWYDGGFRFTDPSRDYFYTLTVASVSNYRYPYQEYWPGNPAIGHTASTGTKNNQPLATTWITLVQADYTFWLTRTTPGTFSSLPKIETYTVPLQGSLDEAVTCPQIATTISDWNYCDPWVDLTSPGGGSWVEGSPDGWPTPTVTYGTGEFQATLNWVNNDQHATDLDLHLYGPDDMHVNWSSQTSIDGSLQLDRDWLDDFGNAVENIYSLSTMPPGTYQVKVKLFSGDPVTFNTRVIRSGNVKTHTAKHTEQKEEILIDEFTL